MKGNQFKGVLRIVAVSFIVLFCFSGLKVQAAEPEPVMVFAAASTTNALTEIIDLFKRSAKTAVIPSFASSSTLAKQIQSGAPAAIYLSADNNWMDFLEEKKLIEPGTRHALLSNRIVLVAPADSPLTLEILPGFDLSGALGQNRLAMGDPAHVPAGIYGKQALESLGVWEAVKDRIAPAKDVRSALVLVERGEAPIGIVYATDAAITGKVRIVGRFPENSHPPIVYPVALVAGNKSEAAVAFLSFLKGPEARAIFEKYGFSVR